MRLRLPPLVGYLLAGIALSPYTPGWVADAHLAPQLAEIGVMLLMFGVGTHFSLRDLLAVKAIAIPGAVAQIAVATALGMRAAHLWGWPLGAGLLFGLALSVASTVVLLRALEQRGSLDSDDGRIAVGWLLVEDLVTVLALVLLPALAGVLGGEAPPGLRRPRGQPVEHARHHPRQGRAVRRADAHRRRARLPLDPAGAWCAPSRASCSPWPRSRSHSGWPTAAPGCSMSRSRSARSSPAW